MTASLADNFEELHNADDAEEIFEELLRKLEDFEPEDRRAILGSFVDQCNEKLQEIEDVFLDDEDED